MTIVQQSCVGDPLAHPGVLLHGAGCRVTLESCSLPGNLGDSLCFKLSWSVPLSPAGPCACGERHRPTQGSTPASAFFASPVSLLQLLCQRRPTWQQLPGEAGVPLTGPCTAPSTRSSGAAAPSLFRLRRERMRWEAPWARLASFPPTVLRPELSQAARGNAACLCCAHEEQETAW